MEYYPGIKRNELQMYGSICMNLRNILLKGKKQGIHTYVVNKQGKGLDKRDIPRSGKMCSLKAVCSWKRGFSIPGDARVLKLESRYTRDPFNIMLENLHVHAI